MRRWLLNEPELRNFLWALLMAAALVIGLWAWAGCLVGCHMHVHLFEKHYTGQEAVKAKQADDAERRIEEAFNGNL